MKKSFVLVFLNLESLSSINFIPQLKYWLLVQLEQARKVNLNKDAEGRTRVFIRKELFGMVLKNEFMK